LTIDALAAAGTVVEVGAGYADNNSISVAGKLATTIKDAKTTPTPDSLQITATYGGIEDCLGFLSWSNSTKEKSVFSAGFQHELDKDTTLQLRGTYGANIHAEAGVLYKVDEKTTLNVRGSTQNGGYLSFAQKTSKGAKVTYSAGVDKVGKPTFAVALDF